MSPGAATTHPHPILFILGPTGIGKSALAMALAQRTAARILNCDSIQAYQHIHIGAAKPSPQEQRDVPHDLLDIIAPPQVLTAADFRQRALPLLDQNLRQGPVFAVGGSGFYIRALEKGLYDVRTIPPHVLNEVRRDLQQQDLPSLYSELKQRDPDYAAKLAPQDHYRIHRALEILRATGQRMSELRAQFQPTQLPYLKAKICLQLDREKLRHRIEQRTQKMLAMGLVDEVQQLVSFGLSEWWPLKAVGYRECVAYLKGDLAREALEPAIVTSTMQLAKRQMTWFRRDPEITWLDGDQSPQSLLEAAFQVLDSARSGLS